MPLVNGNMCPVSIDVVKPILKEYEEETGEELDEDEEEYKRDHKVMHKSEHFEFFDDPDGAYDRRLEGRGDD